MKIANQTSAELIHVGKLIADTPVAMLTTRNATDALTSRPMAALEMDAQGALWFLTDLRSGKVEQLDTVNLAFVDIGKSTYVSLTGRGTLDTDRERIKQLWSPMARPWFPEGADSVHLAALKFIPDSADYWDGPSSKMVQIYSIIAAVIAGKPVAMGEHGTLSGLSRDS
jgi:general stress protein 26